MDEDEEAASGSLSDSEIKELVTDLKDLMQDLDFDSIAQDADAEEDIETV